MNTENQEKITQLFGDDKSIEILIEILNLPNDQFDEIVDDLSKNVLEVIETPNFQKEILGQNLSMYSAEELDESRKEIESVMQDIMEDDTLSDKKKEFLKMFIEKSLVKIYDLVENPREKIPVEIRLLNSDAELPNYAHATDAGADICAIKDTIIQPGNTLPVSTGIAVAIPKGYEIQVRPRSGLSLKSPLRIANAPGTIDSEYRGEIKVLMTNTGDTPFVINKGDKIAQLVIAPVPMIKWVLVDELDETSRGTNGFGSTDKS